VQNHLTENSLRAFSMCPRRYQHGLGVPLNPKLRIAQRTIEALFVRSIRKGLSDPGRSMQGILLRAVAEYNKEAQLLEPQIEKLHREVTFLIDDFFNYLPLSKYVPIMGPFESTIRAGKATVNLHFSGLLKAEHHRTIHAVTFCPMSDRHSMMNDIPTYLKVCLLDSIVRGQYNDGRAVARAHIFAVNEIHGRTTNQLPQWNYRNYTGQKADKTQMKQIKMLGAMLLSSYSLPTIPCPDKECKLRNRCNNLSEAWKK
jgi:hypothetical protein